MLIWIKETLMQILIWILGFIDCVFEVFRSVAGLDSVTTTSGDEQTLTEYFLSLGGVQQAFWVVFIAAIGICAVCTVVAIIKNIINAKGGEPKSHVRTLGQSLSTTVVSLFMATLLVTGVACADGLLSIVDKSMNGSNEFIMSHEIISISLGDSYILDTDDIQGLNKYDEDGNCTYVSYLYEFDTVGGKPKYKESRDGKDYILYQKPDGTGHYEFDNIYDQIFDDDYNPVYDDDGYVMYKLLTDKLTPQKAVGGWNRNDNGDFYTKDNLAANMWNEHVSHILGEHNSFVVPTSWKGNGMVADPDDFNFIIAYICAIALLIALIGATFGLVKRLFDIVILFIVLPGIAATIPLDDGAKFKLWRETVISKVFLAFGTVLAVNVFTIVAPSLLAVSIGNAEFDVINSVLRLVLICGGALTISGGQLLFARLLGTSAEESREMGQSARTMFAGATTALGGVKAAGRLAFGTKNAYGQRVGGLIKGGAGALGAIGSGAINATGSLIGGQAYRNSRFSQSVSATRYALSGFSQSGGWLGKDRMNPEKSYTLGSGVSSGVSKLGSKLAGSGAAQHAGINNGIAGAVKAPIARRGEAARQNARGMMTQANASLAAAQASVPMPKPAATPLDYNTGREVVAGFEGGAPSNLPAPIISGAQKQSGRRSTTPTVGTSATSAKSAAQKAVGKGK